MKITPKTLKGFRDFLPEEARRRQFVIDVLKKTFESYGFEPLETPTLEYAEILEGKYGEEGDLLMYKFEDRGGRSVAMRYDQTVPLARVVAENENTLPMPFKRYQIQNVFRAENTQKGRFREFLQCDIDIVNAKTNASDAEIVSLAYESLKKLGFDNFKILVNDRRIFEGVEDKAIVIIDKLEKIGRDEVIKELITKKLVTSTEIGEKLLAKIEQTQITDELADILKVCEKLGAPKGVIQFSPTLARGLDYYTSTIIEVKVEGYEAGSVGGGGRYDNLIGLFSNNKIPAVGFSFGFDRLIEAMEQFDLFPKELSTTKVLVTVFSKDTSGNSIDLARDLRNKGINTEVYLEENTKLEKQIKYADRKNIPYVVILGPEEIEKNVVTVKNLRTGQQSTLEVIKLIDVLS